MEYQLRVQIAEKEPYCSRINVQFQKNSWGLALLCHRFPLSRNRGQINGGTTWCTIECIELPKGHVCSIRLQENSAMPAKGDLLPGPTQFKRKEETSKKVYPRQEQCRMRACPLQVQGFY